MKQTISINFKPTIYTDFYNRNTVVTDWLGWCMAYVSFGSEIWGGSSAYNGWLAADYKHGDRNFPIGVWVPIWFDFYSSALGEYTNIAGDKTTNWGHTAWLRKNADGSIEIYSSPISRKDAPDKWSSIEQVEKKYGAKFIGWSEDINGTKVMENSMYEKQAIDPGLVSQHFSNYTHGHTIVQPGDAACKDRFEIVGEDADNAFWRGLNAHQLDVIKSCDAQIADLNKKLSEALAGGSNLVPAAQVDGKVTLWREK